MGPHIPHKFVRQKYTIRRPSPLSTSMWRYIFTVNFVLMDLFCQNSTRTTCPIQVLLICCRRHSNFEQGARPGARWLSAQQDCRVILMMGKSLSRLNSLLPEYFDLARRKFCCQPNIGCEGKLLKTHFIAKLLSK